MEANDGTEKALVNNPKEGVWYVDCVDELLNEQFGVSERVTQDEVFVEDHVDDVGDRRGSNWRVENGA